MGMTVRIHRKLHIEELEPRIAPSWLEIGTGSATLGGISNTPGNSSLPAVAITPSGEPIVAWQDSSTGDAEIYVLRWSGTSWAELAGSASGGGISNNGGESISPAIAIGTDGNPVVAWADNSSGNYEIYVRRWNGISWAEIGFGSATGAGISNTPLGESLAPALVVGADGNPIVAWQDTQGTAGIPQIYVRRWNGTAWVEVGTGSAFGGGISNTSTASQSPSMTLGTNGYPIVAWQCWNEGNQDIYVRYWNGSVWAEYMSGTMGSASGGGISNNPTPSAHPSITTDTAGNPVVAWENINNFNYEIYVKRWNGASWVEYVDAVTSQGSASGGGISNNTGGSVLPTIGIWTDGNPIVAWQDNTASPWSNEIYVLQWNGSSWVEMGLGSASGGGISNNSGNSANPRIALSTSGDPVVVWADDTSGNNEIYVRRWSPTIAPTIVSLTPTPDPVYRPNTLTLTANGVSDPDGTVMRVEFYYDANMNDVFDGTLGDVLLGADTAGTDGWAWSGSTRILPVGMVRYFARAQDNDGAWSSVVTVTGEVRIGPVIQTLTDSPDPLWRPDVLTLTATDVTYIYGTVTKVEFYLDTNANGVLDTDSDMLLGVDTNGMDGWSWSGTTGNFPMGTVTYFARAQGNGSEEEWGEAVLTRGEIAPWVQLGPTSAIGGGVSATGHALGTDVNPYFGADYTDSVSIAIGTDGNPIVAWADDSSGNPEIYVRRWNGSAWVEMGVNSASDGGISNNWTVSTHPVVAIGAGGVPIVAWVNYDTYGQGQIYVRRWSGSGWIEMGTASASGGGISNNMGDSTVSYAVFHPTLAIGEFGDPIIAWINDEYKIATGEHTYDVYVRRWNGTAWISMDCSGFGGGISGNGYAWRPAIAVDGDGKPIVAWDDGCGIYVRRWNGYAWAELGPGSASDRGISNTTEGAYEPAIAIGTDGYPIIAWSDASNWLTGSREIYVRRWNGTAWVEYIDAVSQGSASGGGISNTPGNSAIPSIAIGGDGLPIVAWMDDTNGNWEIYVRRWNGSSWIDTTWSGTTVGSATAGGISNNKSVSWGPSIAVGTDGNPIVAWLDRDMTTGSGDIYVRQWVEPPTNQPPTIAALLGSPNLVVRPGPLTLIASGVVDADGTVSLVQFYRDLNGNGILEVGVDTLVGTAGVGTDGTATLTLSTTGFPVWTNTFFARAQDDGGRWSSPVATRVEVFNPPTASVWVEMLNSATGGGISNNDGASRYPAIAIGKDGYPIVAWVDDSSGNAEIYVRRWNGQSWVEYMAGTQGSASGGGISNTPAGSYNPAIAIGTDGYPIVAWQDDSYGNPEIYVRHWTGTEWAEYLDKTRNNHGSATTYGISDTPGYSWSPAVTIGVDGQPIVVWQERAGLNWEIYALKWNPEIGNEHWEPIGGSASGGGISNNTTDSRAPAIAIDGTGRPVVVWEDWGNGTTEIYVRRWSGGAWNELGAGSASGGGISNTTQGNSLAPSITIGADGNPIVAWHEYSNGNWEIYVRRWDGVSWVEMGAGSASGGGISDNPTNSLYPFILTGADNNPIVAWYNQVASSTNYEIYARRWTGSSWVEMGTFGAAFGGISDNSGLSALPVMAIGQNGNPLVAWMDDSSGNFEIYLRRWLAKYLQPPSISYLVASPDQVTRPGTITLIAGGVNDPDGAVVCVEFWHDANFNGVFDGTNGDMLLGTDYSTAGGWTWTGSSTLFPLGRNTFFARAQDNDGLWGEAITEGNVLNVAPVIGWLVDSPDPVVQTDILTLTANNVTDTDGFVVAVEFWHDANRNGLFDGTAGDTLLGTDGDPTGGWSWSGPTTSLPLGINTYFARALDNDGTWGAPVSATGLLSLAGSWVEMPTGSATGGGISSNAGRSRAPSMIIGPTGHPIIAWQDDSSGDAEIYVKQWNGSTWVEMGAGSASGGGVSNNSGASLCPALAYSPAGSPVLVWQDNSSGSWEIYAKWWDGAAWLEYISGTQGSASGGGISNTRMGYAPSVAIGTDGNPIVAWQNDSGVNSEIYVRRWDGSSWVEMGAGSASGRGISQNLKESWNPQVAVGPDGVPYVVWHDYSGGNSEIFIRKWNGSSWVEIGAGSASGGGISNNPGYSGSPVIAFGTDGNPVVAWYDNSSGNYEIYVRRWDGSSWVEVISGSATGGGISNNTGTSGSPTLGFNTDGVPVVAWVDNTGGDNEIFVRAGFGGTWIEMGAGSASGGGISHNAGYSGRPTLVITTNGIPIVAWEDDTNGNYEIYLRRWVPPSTEPPTIQSLMVSPDAVTRPNTVTLVAHGVTDGTGVVTLVEFWRDGTNGNGIFGGESDGDILLGTGSPTSTAGVWTWCGPTTNFPTGTITYFVRAKDNDGLWSIWDATTGAATGTVLNAAPRIVSLSDTPDPVLVGSTLTLTAYNASDPDGTIVQVRFWADTNGDSAGDILLGTDTSDDGGWSWSGLTTLFSASTGGTYIYLAYAQDNEGAWSNPVLTTGVVRTLEVLPSLYGGQVILYDTDVATSPDVSASNVVVTTNAAGVVTGVKIIGNPTGLGLLVRPKGGAAVAITDARTGTTTNPLKPLAFVACAGTAGYAVTISSLSLKTGITGWAIGEELMAKNVFSVTSPDLDADGRVDDSTAFYLGGPVKTLKALGDVCGDIVVKGRDAYGMGIGTFSLSKGDLRGDIFVPDGGLKYFTLSGGDLMGDMTVNGPISTMTISSAWSSTAGQYVGGNMTNCSILAATLGTITIKGNLLDSSIHAGGTYGAGVWSNGHGNIKSISIYGTLVNSNILAGVMLGANERWDNNASPPNADIVASSATGTSVISKVYIKNTVTSFGRFGILAASNIVSVRIVGMGLTLTSSTLPWPNGNYAANNGFLVDYQGRWL